LIARRLISDTTKPAGTVTWTQARIEQKDSLQYYARISNLPDLSGYRLKSDTTKPGGTVTWTLARIEQKDSLQYYARISNLPSLTGYRLVSDTTKPAGTVTWTQTRIEQKDSLQYYARIANLPDLSGYRLKSDTTKPAGTPTWTLARIEQKDSLQYYARLSNLITLAQVSATLDSAFTGPGRSLNFNRIKGLIDTISVLRDSITQLRKTAQDLQVQITANTFSFGSTTLGIDGTITIPAATQPQSFVVTYKDNALAVKPLTWSWTGTEIQVIGDASQIITYFYKE